MNEWEARYEALAAGVDDPLMVAIACGVVRSAQHLASHSPQSFTSIFGAIMCLIRHEQNERFKRAQEFLIPTPWELVVFEWHRLWNAIGCWLRGEVSDTWFE